MYSVQAQDFLSCFPLLDGKMLYCRRFAVGCGAFSFNFQTYGRLMRNYKQLLIAFFSATQLVISNAQAAVVTPPPPAVAAKGYMLIDYNTGKVIAEQNADIRLEPASLTKMMTSYIV